MAVREASVALRRRFCDGMLAILRQIPRLRKTNRASFISPDIIVWIWVFMRCCRSPGCLHHLIHLPDQNYPWISCLSGTSGVFMGSFRSSDCLHHLIHLAEQNYPWISCLSVSGTSGHIVSCRDPDCLHHLVHLADQNYSWVSYLSGTDQLLVILFQ